MFPFNQLSVQSWLQSGFRLTTITVYYHSVRFSAKHDHYYGNRLKAAMELRKYLSIIVDGMDQAKTNIPYVTNISKVILRTITLYLV